MQHQVGARVNVVYRAGIIHKRDGWMHSPKIGRSHVVHVAVRCVEWVAFTKWYTIV